VAEKKYDDDLVRDLTVLGRAIDPPASPERLATAVMDRVRSLPPPVETAGVWNHWRGQIERTVAASVRSRRRRIALVVGTLLVALLATPPVRAAVSDWFGFGGVVVERGSAGPGPAPPPPEVPRSQSLTAARDAVDFTVWAPAQLGNPDGVAVSADRRIVSMTWTGDEDGVVRLDQFDGRLDFSLAKRAPGVLYASVGGTDALWFEAPHEVVLLEPDGTRRSQSARLAGHTLIWQDGHTTLRIEGDLSLGRAVEIAESAVPVP
jgi:hypothetical protein